MFSKKAFLFIFESVMASILLLDIDFWLKLLTFIVAAIVGYYSVKANKASERKSNIEAEIKAQELYRLMQENKEREKKLKQKENEQE